MRVRLSLLILVTLMFLIGSCHRGSKPSSAPTTISGALDGKRIVIKPDALSEPYKNGDIDNTPQKIARPAGAWPQLPSGFAATLFAEGDFKRPRNMIEATNGDLFLSDAEANSVFLLRDANGDGRVDNGPERFAFLTGLNQPFGMAIRGGYFYVANTDSVVRYKYQLGQTAPEGPAEKLIDLPGKGYNQHWTRNLIFSPDGEKIYVSVGSESNSRPEEPRRAAINQYNADGAGHRVFASGLRNPVGLAWNPATGELWTTVNERDGIGDDLVPDYATSVQDGGFYGWPYFYIGAHEQPWSWFWNKRPDLKSEVLVPDVLIEAHGAALGLAFYTGAMFPEEYRGDAFVALHGSWNRRHLHGYKVIRIPFENGKPEGGYENFMAGWISGSDAKEVWGRPVGILARSDGSLLVVDDLGNCVWRVVYGAAKK
ncbi:MAG: PQQ-dependent sugar dehydrogenase [Blastocatellia bacterium]